MRNMKTLRKKEMNSVEGGFLGCALIVGGCVIRAGLAYAARKKLKKVAAQAVVETGKRIAATLETAGTALELGKHVLSD